MTFARFDRLNAMLIGAERRAARAGAEAVTYRLERIAQGFEARLPGVEASIEGPGLVLRGGGLIVRVEADDALRMPERLIEKGGA